MISFEEALARVLADVSTLAAVELPIDEAAGKVLAEDVRARWPLPRYPNSAMDGWAVRAEDVAGANARAPVVLRVVGRLFAGERPEVGVGRGEACRIFTGAALPDGADAVLRQEHVRADERRGQVTVTLPVQSGTDVRPTGEDVDAEALVAREGAPLDPGTVALLAAVGHARVRVRPAARVAILATGDEIAPGPADPAPFAIVDSVGPGLAALVVETGGVPERTPPLPDDAEAIAGAIRASTSDVVVTIGGASVGERDAVAEAWDRAGVRTVFWRVRMRPGKPVRFGVLGDRPVFALPGNPHAAMTAFEVLVRPAIRARMGRAGGGRGRVQARLSAPVEKQSGSTYFQRARLEQRDGGLFVRLPPRQGAGTHVPAAAADALVVLPAGPARLEAGDLVEVRVLRPDVSPEAERRRGPAPVVAVTGPSGSGKTTLVETLVRLLSARGVRVGTIKRSSCEVEPDRPGKDSYRHRKAGAVRAVLEAVGARGVFEDTDTRASASELVRRFFGDVDLVLAEGFHDEPIPRIEVGPSDPTRLPVPPPRRWRLPLPTGETSDREALLAVVEELMALALGDESTVDPATATPTTG